MKRLAVLFICLLTFFLIVSRGKTQSVSVLQGIADAMPEGTWAEVTGSNVNSGALRCSSGNGCLGESSLRMLFQNHMAWDDENSVLYTINEDHNEVANANSAYGPGHTQAFIKYDEASNTWTLICGGGNAVSTPCGTIDSTHGYNMINLDRLTGIVYHKENGNGGGSGTLTIDRYPVGGPWASPYKIFNPISEITGSLQYWPGTTVAGSDYGGSIVNYNCYDGAGDILFLSPNQNAGAGNWYHVLLNAHPGGVSSNQCVSSFSEMYDTLVYGGGTSDFNGPGSNDNIRKLWKVDSSLTPAALPNAPINLGVTQGNVETDPVSGNIVIVGNDGHDSTSCTVQNVMYELNLQTSTYTLQTGSRAVPNKFPSMFNNSCAGGSGAVISAPMPRHGVIAYVVYSYVDSQIHMFLYKHKAPETFMARCAHSGVVTCEGFDDNTGIQHFDSPGGGTYVARGVFAAGSDSATYALATRDTAVHSDGLSALEMTIPAVTAGNPSVNFPYWYTSAKSDFTGQYGAGQQFYMAWRQMMDANFINNHWEGGQGIKQASFGQGDTSNATNTGACTAVDVAMFNWSQEGLPGLEQGCGVYTPINENFYPPVCVGGACADITLQNSVPTPGCLYNSSAPGYKTPNNCFFYPANKWVAYKVWVKFGQLGHAGVIGASPNDQYVGTQFKEWVQVEGEKRWRLIHSLSGVDWYSQGQTVGKFFLQYQHTGMCVPTCTSNWPAAHTWFDEFTLSNSNIMPFADPNVVSPAASFTITKVAPTTAATSSPIAYTIGIANGGSTVSGTAATVLDQLPAGITAVSATPGSGVSSVTCSNLGTPGALLSCAVTLNAGLVSLGTASFTLNATTPSSPGPLTNYASVNTTASTGPPTPGPSCLTTNCANALTTIGNAGPVATITSPLNNTKVQGFLQASTSVVPNGAPVSSVQYEIDGVNVGNAYVVSPYPLLYNLQPVKPGQHTLAARACDTLARCSTITILIQVVPRDNIIKKIFGGRRSPIE